MAQVDDRISALTTALDQVGSELVELDGDDFRQLLASTPLTGATALKWARADAEAKLVWSWYLAAKDWFGPIVERRGTKSGLPSDLRDELTGKLDKPPADILPGKLSPAGNAPPARMDALLPSMLAATRRVSSVVASVATVWQETAPRLGALESEAGAVEKQATQAGLRPPNELAVARRLLAETRKRCAEDPLSFAGQGDPVAPIAAGLERARAAVQGAIASRGTFATDTAALAAELDSMLAELATAADMERESQAKIAGQGELGQIDAATADLQRLGAELERVRAETDLGAAVRALAAVRERVTAELTHCRRLVQASGAGLAHRNELRGRLDAYRAKALAIGRAEDAELDALYRQARDALFTAPCDLPHSESLVLAYQRALTPARQAADA